MSPVYAVARVTKPQIELFTPFHAACRVRIVARTSLAAPKRITRKVVEVQLTKENRDPNQRLEADLRTRSLRSPASSAQPSR
jgi:hypothetical protein